MKRNDQNARGVSDSNKPKRFVGIGYQCWFPPHECKNTWDRPMLGNYHSSYPSVIRKHARWIKEAGRDFVRNDWLNNVENIEGEKL